MPLTRRRITAANEMKALAHPLRLDLLDLLVVRGSMTASEAAVVLRQTPANVSWHLRKLAEHGFVRQATEGPGRRRPWKAVAQSLMWGEDAEDDTTAAALGDIAFEREFQRLRAAVAALPAEPEAWRDATTVNQSRLWLTAEEAKELGAQMRDLFWGKADRFTDPSARPPGARVMALMGWIVPSGPLEPQSPADPADPH
ncbi:MAG: helix-turn-helix transcriptional regulator, partial [Nocardioidaceae bacterium]|nr:helix-turn-helix transcriptional regulator [Nocardioidaceae bacterium]